MIQNFDKLKAEHGDLVQKYKLVSDLLTAKSSENEAFEKFKELFEGEFMDFANKESSLADEAAAVQRLQTLEKRLEQIVAFPHTFTKRSIAIGGGFSSGKSEFVNSFIEHPDIKLPVGIQPVTAIPSYVMDGVDASIKGYSRTGGTVDISPDFYVQLSRDFIDTFSFNVKDLMPAIAVEVPLQADLFEHIYLIDTPGYNPAGGQTSEDEATSAEFLKDRDALIWMIGLDATGTVSESDLEFIEGLELNGLPFYVVLNKADLKPESDLKDIVEEVWDTLDDVGIEPVGISAYSATRRKEYLYEGTALHDFFRSQNHFVEDQGIELKKEIEDVFEMYEKAIDDDEKTAYLLRNQLNSLNLDINELGVDSDAVDVLQEKIDKIKNSQNKNFVPIKVEMKKIKTKMLRAVDEIFWSLRSQSVGAELQPLTVPTPDSKESTVKQALPWYFPQEAVSQRQTARKSTVKRQGYIRGEKYVKTDDEQSERVSLQPHFDSRDFKKKPKKIKRVYEVAHEFNLSSIEMIARLLNLGFQVKDHMSVCTPVMVEAVQRELGTKRRAKKKNTQAASQTQALININQATAKELERLPSICSKIAKRIVAYRKQNGLFQRIDDLINIRGISLKMLNDMISINQATAKELERLPGIGPEISKRIVAYRKQNGPFQRIDDLIKVQGISLRMLNDLRSKLEWNLIDVLRQAKKQ